MEGTNSKHPLLGSGGEESKETASCMDGCIHAYLHTLMYNYPCMIFYENKLNGPDLKRN